MGEIEAEYFFRGNNPKNRMMYVKRQFQKCKKPHRETKILLDILHELLKLKLLMAFTHRASHTQQGKITGGIGVFSSF